MLLYEQHKINEKERKLRDPEKEKRTLSDAFPPDPKLVRLTELISAALRENHRGKEFCIVELIHAFKDLFKAQEDDVKVALSTLITREEIRVKSVCFLYINTVKIPE